MHSNINQTSTMIGVVAGCLLIVCSGTVTLSQAADPIEAPPSQEKAVQKGDPAQVQERGIGTGLGSGPRTFSCSPADGTCRCNGSYEDCNAMERNCQGQITCAPMVGCYCKMKK